MIKEPGIDPTDRSAQVMVRHAVLASAALLLSAPFIWMLLCSLKAPVDLGSSSWLPGRGGWQWQNYLEVFEVIPFGRFYLNSLLIASWVTLLQTFTSAMAAYGFARLHWPKRDSVFLVYLATLMLPGLVLMIPNFQIMVGLGLVDTLAGLVIPSAFSAYGTFLLRQFMVSIPASLDEAAEIDGASNWQIFTDVILPIARPALVTLAVLTFTGNMHSFFWPLVMLRSETNYTLPIGLLYFDSTSGQATHLLMAAVTLSVAPLAVAFVFLQKYIVQGINIGGVKG